MAEIVPQLTEILLSSDLDKKPVYDPLLKAMNRYVGFYGAQVAFWGALLIPLLIALMRRDERKWF